MDANRPASVFHPENVISNPHVVNFSRPSANPHARYQLQDGYSNTRSRTGQPRSSSVYSEDIEWDQRVSRLSISPAWLNSNDPKDVLSIRDELVDELPHHGLPEIKHPDVSIVEKGLEIGGVRTVQINRDLRTRNFCISTLVLGVGIGITSFVLGCEFVTSGRVLMPEFFKDKYITMGTIDYPFPSATTIYYISGHRVFSVPEAAMLLINLVLNTGLTIIFEGMNFIQTATLRWSLCKEGRLVFNSNPRLFTGACHFAPNWRITNFVSSIALVLAYGSISVLSCSIYVVGMSTPDGFLDETRTVTGNRYAIDFNGWGFVGLGISLILQGSICSWCLAKSKIVPTWSSNPFNTALVCEILGLAEKNRPTKKETPSPTVTSPLGTPHRVDTQPTWKSSPENGLGVLLATPQPKQPPMRAEIPRTRKFVYFIWGLLALIALWIIIILAFGLKTKSCDRQYIEDMNYRLDFLAYWQSWCQVGIPYYSDPWFDRRDWPGLLIASLVLSLITLGMHCAELVTDITRDEAAWRKATTTGADAGRGALMEGATAWECWVLFAFKALTPWVFSMAFNTNLFVFSNLMPLLVLGLVMFLLAIFAEHLIRRQPNGPQPSTYGNIAKLAGLVDEFHDRIFWGDKGFFKGDFRITNAGTSGQRLADLDISMLYANLRV